VTYHDFAPYFSPKAPNLKAQFLVASLKKMLHPPMCNEHDAAKKLKLKTPAQNPSGCRKSLFSPSKGFLQMYRSVILIRWRQGVPKGCSPTITSCRMPQNLTHLKLLLGADVSAIFTQAAPVSLEFVSAATGQCAVFVGGCFERKRLAVGNPHRLSGNLRSGAKMCRSPEAGTDTSIAHLGMGR
jgi:hypothetical protein